MKKGKIDTILNIMYLVFIFYSSKIIYYINNRFNIATIEKAMGLGENPINISTTKENK